MAARARGKGCRMTFISTYEEVTPEFYEYLLNMREDILARWLARLILKGHETNSIKSKGREEGYQQKFKN